MSGSRMRAWADAGLRGPFGPLLTPAQVLNGPPPSYDDRTTDRLRAMAGYLTGFLTAPHPQLGRPGAVCPFAARGLQEEAIRLTAFVGEDCTRAAVMAGMERLRE